MRLAFRDLDQRARDAVRLATDNQVRLGVEVSNEAVAKHGVRVHDEDTFFFDGRLPNYPGHCSYDRVSKTKSADKVNALDNPHVVLLLCDGGPSLTREEAAAFALLVARSRILADLSVISVYVSVVVRCALFALP